MKETGTMNSNRNLFPLELSPDSLQSTQSCDSGPLLPTLPLRVCVPSWCHTKHNNRSASCSSRSGPAAEPEHFGVVLSVPNAPVLGSLEKSEAYESPSFIF